MTILESQVFIKVHQIFKSLWCSYNEVLFINSPYLGFLICLFTFAHPNIGFSGFAALLFCKIFLLLFKVDHHYLIRKIILFNSLLIGLFIGYLFKVNFISLFIILISTGFILLVSYFLNSILITQSLPILSLPFSLVSIFIALSTPAFSSLSDGTSYFIEHSVLQLGTLPNFIQEGFRSIGSIFCIPDILFGVLVFSAVFIFSPLTAIFLFLGFLINFELEKSLVFSTATFTIKHHYFNSALIFTSIAGIFLIPSRYSFLWATFGSAISILVSASSFTFWQNFGVPITALPFNFVVLIMLRAIKTIDPSQLVTIPAQSPEKLIERAKLLWLRHRTGEIGVFCPLENECTIQQGFQGEWTHRGQWQHALDFVIEGQDGKTYKNQGIELDDYLIYAQPVVSPVEGHIVNLCSSIPDNLIGKVDNQNNWGNFITIKTFSGVYVTLAHLKKDSIDVSIGDYVVVGRNLALCGNSGYSQEPHLHLQVQLSPSLGSPTIPFHLINYSIARQAHFHRTPNVREKISSLKFNKVLDRLLTFRIGQTWTWNYIDSKHKSKQVIFKHCLDEISGLLYWTDNQSRIYYSRVGSQFYLYGLEATTWSPLCDFYVALPRVPITLGQPFEYKDYLPLFLTHSIFSRWFCLIWQFISSQNTFASANYIMDPTSLEIHGKAQVRGHYLESFCKLDPMTGLTEFQVGNRRYVRIL